MLQLISATEAAFLNQATVLITPVLMFLAGGLVRRNDWAACCLALLGSGLVAADGLASAGAGAGPDNVRHLCVHASCGLNGSRDRGLAP